MVNLCFYNKVFSISYRRDGKVLNAIRTERPYRKALEVQTVVRLMKEAAGNDFNPMLVDNFLNALKRIGIF